MTNNELDFGPPFYQYLNQWHDGGVFSHAFAGGNDTLAMSGTGGQYVSLERLLMAMLPLSAAHALHKIMVTAVGFIGIYRIGRYFENSRALCCVLAAAYTLSFNFLTVQTWFVGVGYAVIPLVAYYVVFRAGQQGYFRGVLAVAALTAISSDPVHSFLVLGFSLALAALLVNTRRWPRMALGVAVVVALEVLNWHEALYGMAALSPLTHRFLVGTDIAHFDFFDQLHALLGSYGNKSGLILAALGGMTLLAVEDRARAIGTLAVLLVAAFGGPLINQVPWEALGLKTVGAINFQYLSGATPLVAVIVTASAAALVTGSGHTGLPRFIRPQTLVALIFAIAVGQFGWYKAYNASVWLSEGSLGKLTKAAERLSLNWVPSEPVRVVSVPYRLSANFAPALGLHAFDGFTNLSLYSVKSYWENGIIGLNNPSHDFRSASGASNLGLIASGTDYKCCRDYDIAVMANLDLLRVVNVGYILSVLPLSGNVVQVAGPEDPESVPPRRDTPLTTRIGQYFRLIFRPSPIRVYALSSPLPRVYAATSWMSVPDDLPEKQFLRLVAKHGPDRTAIVSERFARKIIGVDAPLKIRSFGLVPDGVDIELSASESGLIIINIPYSPFWRAYVEGSGSAQAFPVNLAQMGVLVPAGASSVAVRYERALLRDKILTWVKRMFEGSEA
jgi:hypothetical protein